MKSNLHHFEIENKIISNLKNAEKSVKIAMAWFTNSKFFNLVDNLINNGVNVEIVLSDEKLNFINKKIDFQKLIDKNVNLKISEFPNLMHNKFCIIDNRILITGSYNWTLKAEKSNYENIIISTDEKLVDDFVEYFKYLIVNLKTVSKISDIKFNEYFDKKEVEIELKLIQNDNEEVAIIEKSGLIKLYNDELNEAINKADLLYLNRELKESIIFINIQLEKYSNVPEFYQILALCFWRLKDFEKQIIYSEKVIELENDTELSLKAYNLLGIAYSLQKGGEQKSIFYYKKCIDKDCNEHTFYRNRALSYVDLELLPNLPIKMRNSYKQKADADFKKIIEIANDAESKDYQLLHSESIANNFLGKPKLALGIINKSLVSFNSETDIFNKDQNEFKEIKALQKALMQFLK